MKHTASETLYNGWRAVYYITIGYTTRFGVSNKAMFLEISTSGRDPSSHNMTAQMSKEEAQDQPITNICLYQRFACDAESFAWDLSLWLLTGICSLRGCLLHSEMLLY